MTLFVNFINFINNPCDICRNNFTNCGILSDSTLTALFWFQVSSTVLLMKRNISLKNFNEFTNLRIIALEFARRNSRIAIFMKKLIHIELTCRTRGLCSNICRKLHWTNELKVLRCVDLLHYFRLKFIVECDHWLCNEISPK